MQAELRIFHLIAKQELRMNLSPIDQNELVSLLQKLVQAESPTGQERLTADIAQSAMTTLNFDRVWRDDYGNVIGERRGSLPGPALLFEAHMDVVAAGKLEDWADDPFSGRLIEGKIYGRGAADTKGSLASLICAIASIPREQIRGTLYAVGSVGEETLEGAGLRKVIQALQPQGVVVGEPTGCRLAIGQKGRARIVFTAHGRPAHSSSPHLGENAVLKGAEIVRRVESLPLPEDSLLGRGVMVPLLIRSKPLPPVMGTIPHECQVLYDRRLIKGETPESVLAEYQQALADLPGWDAAVDQAGFETYTGINLTAPDFHHGWHMPPESAWVQSAANALLQSGIEAGIHAVPYCTNGSVAAGEMGLPTLIFGPGEIAQAHVPNEHISVSELLRGARGYAALAQELSTAF